VVDVDNVSAISPINAADTKGGQGQAPSQQGRGPPPKPPRPPRRESVSDVAFIMGIPAAEMTRVSEDTPSLSRVSAAWRMTGQSDRLPMIMPTVGASMVIKSGSLP
jgi:hypothetical protein